MVMPLPIPPYDSVQLTGEVIDERAAGVNSAYFESIRQEWVARVQLYQDHGGSPEHVPRWNTIPVARKTSFLNLYSAADPQSVQGRMLAHLRNHELNLCPACGEPGQPNTLDHYLPKGMYPHFCVTPVNLFPMCDACQRHKHTKTGSAAEPRFFLHPYFDVFVAEQVIAISIEPPFSSPTFRMQISDHLSAAQRAVVSSHVRELEIEQRFAHFFKAESLRTLKNAHAMRRSGLPVALMLQVFEERYRDPSLNSWDHVYWSAVAGNPAMLDYLANGDLPGAV
jgi:hypothetical protein